MARKNLSKCIVGMFGTAIIGSVTAGGAGAAIEAIPNVVSSLGTPLAITIP